MTSTVEFVAPSATQRDYIGAAAAPWSRFASLAVLLGLAMVAYLPAALRAEFLAFDDNFFFGPDNPEFRDGLIAMFDPSRPIANAYLPVAHVSLWLDWWLFAGKPFGPHLHALVLHGLTAFVFVRLLLRLWVTPLVAHLAAALFVLHPALAESVAWVSGRKDLLAGLFTMVALHQTVRFAAVPGAWRLVAIALAAALAMYAKATAVVLPALVLLVCCVSGGRRLRFVVPFVTAALTGLIAWHHQSIAAAEGTMLAGEAVSRWQQVPGVGMHYLRTTFWPVELNILYPEVQTLERFRAAFTIAGVVVAAALVMAVALLRRPSTRLAGAGVVAFFVALAPFNTAFPASSIAAADRYLHLAVPGMALAVALLAAQWFGRNGVIAVAAALLPLGFLAGSRAHEFTSTEVLWRSSLGVDSDNAVAHFNLATELMRRAPMPLEEVERHLDAAVAAARYPVHELRARRVLMALDVQRADYEGAAAHARGAIAAAEAQLQRETAAGRRTQAETLLVETHLEAFEPLRLAGADEAAAASYAAAVAVVPEHPEVIAFGVLLDLAEIAPELVADAEAGGTGALAADDERAVAAERAIDAALAQHPDHPGLLYAKATWARARGDVLSALRDYLRVERVAPTRIEAWREAARMLRERSQYESAIEHATGGLQHRNDPALRQEWALALIGLMRLDEAIMHLEAYLKVRPQDRDTARVLANVLVGRAYARLSEPGGSHAEALRFIERALAYNPKEAKAHLVLGRIERERREFAKAVEHLEQAHSFLPEFRDAQDMLFDSLRDLGFEHLLQKKDLIAAGDAWLRCLEVAPENADTEGVQLQLDALWRRHKDAAMAAMKAGENDTAIAELRHCRRLGPDQLFVAWPLAMALEDRADVDLDELAQLCREAVRWHETESVDASQPVFLLATTLRRLGAAAEAKQVAADWLVANPTGGRATVRRALEELAR